MHDGGFDPHTPSSARIYDYLLGGKDSFAVDRSVADELITILPELAELVAENRRFLARASAWAARQGVRQFLDLGCGMPAEPTTHDVVQAVDAAAKVVYVEYDRVTISHLRALSEHGHEGVVSVVDADVRDVPGVLKDVSASLDLSQPACVILGCLLHLFPVAEARAVVAGYIAALAPGSFLVLSLGRGDGPRAVEFFRAYSRWASPVWNHSAADVASFFGSLPLVPPGLVDAREWRPDVPPSEPLPPRDGETLAGVAQVTS
ncbi:MAG TPA: SAM-dependent methyltransferase [Trebonia sp.]|nr:SAM-dependent methyltransferase [Trebonia sp.]